MVEKSIFAPEFVQTFIITIVVRVLYEVTSIKLNLFIVLKLKEKRKQVSAHVFIGNRKFQHIYQRLKNKIN